ncbi:MAG: sulfotransferase domain-containing protein [Symploca sp. SIO2B6]|nr:sulfotransferase domain-containing protein [Symploca sp. SIO2B6]
MRLPDFLIIGAAKSGTTTLYKYLCRHPQICMSNPKEPDFFAIDHIYDQGIDWYSSLFSEAGLKQVCGEASTTYTRLPKFPKAAERIAQVLPKVKMIYIIRHPVDRAYSHHVHEIKCHEQKPKTTFEEGIKERSYLVDSGNYMKHIEQYLQFFPRESLLIMLMEDLIHKPADTMEKICSFIGVDDKIDLVQNSPIAANQAHQDAQWFLRSKITSPLRAIPGVVFIANLLPQGLRDLAYQVLKALPYYRKQGEKQSYLPPPMLPETRQMLLEKFSEPNLRLAEFLNRNLSHWNQ